MEPGSFWLLVIIALVSFALAFVGSAVGLVLGHLRLPLLIAYLGSPGAGAMTNLLISGCGALSGSAGHLRAGRVSWTGLALMGIPSAAGAIIAVLIFIQINPLWSYLVISVILVISGLKLMRRKKDEPPSEPISMTRQIVIEVILGLGLGALAAVTGLMLGSLRLPMMIRYLRMDPKEAVGTNMAVGCLTAMIAVATGILAGPGRLDWLVLGVVVPPTVLGGYLGGWLTGKLSKEAVQRLAGAIVTVTGFILAGQALELAFRKPLPYVPDFIVDDNEYPGWFDFDYFDFPDLSHPPVDNPPDEPGRSDGVAAQDRA